MISKLCKHCGFLEEDHDRIYCKYCGSKLKKDRHGFYCKTNSCTWFNGGTCKKFSPSSEKCKTCGHSETLHTINTKKPEFGRYKCMKRTMSKYCKCKKFSPSSEKCQNCGFCKSEHPVKQLVPERKMLCEKFQPEDEMPAGRGKQKKGYQGEDARNWQGGIRITRDGYIEIYSPHHPNKNKHDCVLEHRLVMEKHLGRFLTKKEVVHHIDNNKENNEIENLELFSSVGKHTQAHHIVRNINGRFKKHGK